MSHSLHVVGVKPPDEKWKSMKKVWDSCRDAGVDPPEKVEQFFRGEAPDDAGVLMSLDDEPCTREYSADMRAGFDIDLTKIPKDVKVLRFFVSY